MYVCNEYSVCRSSPPEVLSYEGALKNKQKKHSKSTGKDPRRSATPTKPLCSFIEVTPQRGCSITNPPHKSPKAPSHKSTPKGLHNLK